MFVLKIGVIGVGIITSNIIEAFLGFGKSDIKFFLSPRNRERTKNFKEKYPENITVCQDNQQVLDNSDFVFLGLLPEKAKEILSPLKFKKEHKVIGLIPIIGLPGLREAIGETEILCDVVPLPFISKHWGPIVVYPPVQEVVDLLSPLGKIVGVNSEKEISVLRTITALMSPFYELIYHVVNWGEQNGLSEEAAKAYVTEFFDGLCKMAANTPQGGLKELAEEMTPGGLNAQAVHYLFEQNGFNIWQDALDPVLKRVRQEKED